MRGGLLRRYHLTQAQLAVLEKVAAGKDTRLIGVELTLSPRSIQDHIHDLHVNDHHGATHDND